MSVGASLTVESRSAIEAAASKVRLRRAKVGFVAASTPRGSMEARTARSC
jgi:hypothetical protein